MRAYLWLSLTMLVGACSGGEKDRSEVKEGWGVRLDESEIRARLGAGSSMKVSLVLQRTEGETRAASVTLEVVRLKDGAALSRGQVQVNLAGPTTVAELELEAPPHTAAGALGGYVLRYTVGVPGGELYGKRSLYLAAARTGLIVVGSDRFNVGEKSSLRVMVMDQASGVGLAGREVEVRFAAEKGESRSLTKGATNQLGELEASFTFAEADLGTGTLTVTAETQTYSHPVLVEQTQSQVLLTTDKPLYQPGQVVQIRALAMRHPRVVPVSAEPILIEVEDPQGLKLFKQEGKTDAYGIASLRFTLAKIVSLGSYRVRATLGATVREKLITVDRYQLPKFKVSLVANQPYVKPGEEITGEVRADYFFDKHVEGGTVVLRASLGAKPLTEINGKTDADGRYGFKLAAPATDGDLRLEAIVTDVAGAEARGGATVRVASEPLVIQLVPERATATVGGKLRCFVLLTDPAGAPLAGSVKLQAGASYGQSTSVTVSIPETGIALAELDSPCMDRSGQQWGGYGGDEQIALTASSGAASSAAQLDCRAGEAELRLTTDKALYKAGELANVTLAAAAPNATLEVLRGNQTVSSQTATLTGGKVTLSLPLTGDLKRTLELRAWASVGERIVSDRKLIYVRGADELTVQVATDKKDYRPRETAKVSFTLLDAAGKPAPGALGVQVVDEALYSLTEFKPGIERRTFFLEPEIVDASGKLKHVSPETVLVANPSPADQLRAAMLFASAGQRATFPLSYRSGDVEAAAAIVESRVGFDLVVERLRQEFADAFGSSFFTPSLESRQSWASEWLARRVDDFGVALRYRVEGQSVSITSAGMDERFETKDDLAGYLSLYVSSPGDQPLPLPMMDASAAASDGGAWLPKEAGVQADAGAPAGDAGAAGGNPVRQYFPETLYVNPALITDQQGKAEIELPLADSITTWRLSSIAHTASGQLGSAAHGINAFQEFFIDLVLPTHLLQNDEVAIPVAIYNYLPSAQSVTVSVQTEPWFDLLSAASQQLTVPARSVAAAKFRIRAKKVGSFALTASAKSGTEADAVKRALTVLPDGVRHEVASSGALVPGTVSHTINIPAGAIADASELQVRVFPGLLAEAVTGLESIFHSPYGCFEQTSSATYPNVMVLQYLKAAKLTTPALEAKARGYIDDGYQRLVGYEVEGTGGFSLWGDPPASLVLSAFGLMQFTDMAKVRFVDPALLTRTQSFIIGQQAATGEFPTSGSSWYEIPVDMSRDTLRQTAYVAWALAHSGYKGSGLSSALGYLKTGIKGSSDLYTLALAANALLEASPSDPDGLAAVAALKAKAVAKGSMLYWPSAGCSVSYGYGESMHVETTALALSALLLAKDTGPTTQQGLAWLTASKAGFGGYGTTQATVLAIRALLLALSARGGDSAAGTIQVLWNGVQQGTATVDPSTSDLTRIFDLGSVVTTGDNKIELVFSGSGELAYQVSGAYYLPFQSSSAGPLGFSVSYDRTTLKVGEAIKVTATVTAKQGKVPTVMIRLGLPPGFTVDPDAITAATTNGVVKLAEVIGPYLVLYLGDLTTTQSVQVPMTSTMAASGKAPPSTAYPYYTPEASTIVDTPTVVVNEI